MTDCSPCPAPSDTNDQIVDQVERLRAYFGAPVLAQAPQCRGADADRAISDPLIAIVDDEPVNILVVRKHLQVAGYKRFTTTADSREAVGLVKEQNPDVLLLDIMMPHVSGLDILGQLRRDELLADLPVIILTAAFDRETKLQALSLGATEFLGKPVDTVELTTRLILQRRIDIA